MFYNGQVFKSMVNGEEKVYIYNNGELVEYKDDSDKLTVLEVDRILYWYGLAQTRMKPRKEDVKLVYKLKGMKIIKKI